MYVHPRSAFFRLEPLLPRQICRENRKHVAGGTVRANLLDALVSRCAVHHLASGVVGQGPHADLVRCPHASTVRPFLSRGAADRSMSAWRRARLRGSGVSNSMSGRAAMGRSTATSPIARWQCRRSAQHGIAGPHVKNETAEPWGRAGGLAHFWIGTGNSGDGVALIQYPLFTGDDAQLATALKDNSGQSDP